MIERQTAIHWWSYLDSVALKLAADYADRPDQDSRTPTNPRHTADCLKGKSMLLAAEADEKCRSFAVIQRWPNDLTGDQVEEIQHRLGCAKCALEYMTTYPEDETVITLQSLIPDHRDEPVFIECLLIPIWRLFGDVILEDKAAQLQQLLPPGELERLWKENPPLEG
jgi:hypothetical protein